MLDLMGMFEKIVCRDDTGVKIQRVRVLQPTITQLNFNLFTSYNCVPPQFLQSLCLSDANCD
jgi:hypothetical protein